MAKLMAVPDKIEKGRSVNFILRNFDDSYDSQPVAAIYNSSGAQITSITLAKRLNDNIFVGELNTIVLDIGEYTAKCRITNSAESEADVRIAESIAESEYA